MICARTHIGFGSPNKQDRRRRTATPLGEDEVARRRAYGWPADQNSYVPEKALAHSRRRSTAAPLRKRDWEQRFEAYAKAYPGGGATVPRRARRQAPRGMGRSLPSFSPEDKEVATRVASGTVLNALAGALPRSIGGSADLGESNNTELKGKPA